MSVKSTQYVSREAALRTITSELDRLGNAVLEDLLHVLARSEQSRILSKRDYGKLSISEFGDAAQFRLTRHRALEILFTESEHVGNSTLGYMLDAIADSEQGSLSAFDNFLVSD